VNTKLKRLRTLARIALGRWKAAADRRHAALTRPRMDHTAWNAETRRMDRLDLVQTRLINAMAAL